jgi:hypothetical protein
MLVAPTDAFARLRETPTWGWAYLIAVVLAMLATLALVPALRHAMDASLPAQLAASPNIAKLPPAEQQKQIARIASAQSIILNFTWIGSIVIVPLVAIVQTAVMLLANKIGGGDATFRRLWALALNVQVAGSIGGLILAAIVLIRGAASFDDPAQIQVVLPNLSMLAPGLPHVAGAFLGAINVAAIWQTVLLGLGLIAVARVSRPVAWSTAIVMLLSLGVFAAIGANAQPHG